MFFNPLRMEVYFCYQNQRIKKMNILDVIETLYNIHW
jgi:DUF1365 family protein